MISVSITSDIGSFVKEIATDVAAMSERALNRAGAEIAANMRAAFKSEGVRDGQDQWEKTSKIAASKRKNPPSDSALRAGQYQTLVDTGALRDSVTGSTVGRAQGWVLVVGSDRDYAPLMQFGGPATVDGVSITVPPRAFVNLTDADIAALEAAFEAEPL